MRMNPTLNLLFVGLLSGTLSCSWALAQQEKTSPRTSTLQEASSNLTVTISVQDDRQGNSGTPLLLLTVHNLGKDDVLFPEERIHVTGKTGEPKTTLRQRQVTHTLQQNEPEIRDSGFDPVIEAGQSFTRKIGLKDLYDLSRPGKYSVFAEVLDAQASRDNAGIWVRSRTITFEVSPTAP